MYVTVHRGTRQIGGNLIEIGTDQTRLLFDAGVNLPPLDSPKTEDPFELEGLTCGKPAFDWGSSATITTTTAACWESSCRVFPCLPGRRQSGF